MSSNSSSERLNDWKEKTKFTITTNGTPFGQYRGIVFLSQLDPTTRKIWANKSYNEATDNIIIGPVNGQTYRPIGRKNLSRNDDVIFIQNDVPLHTAIVSHIEPDYNYGRYD